MLCLHRVCTTSPTASRPSGECQSWWCVIVPDVNWVLTGKLQQPAYLDGTLAEKRVIIRIIHTAL